MEKSLPPETPVPPTTPNAPNAAAPPRDDRAMTRTYVAVIVVEIVTLLALWWFQRAFSS